LVRLWIGLAPERSGVRSAGNGPAMRSALLGVVFADDPARLAAFVQASTTLTHRDDRACAGALAVACAAACGRAGAPREPARALAALRARIAQASGGEPDPLAPVLAAMDDALARDLDVGAYAASLGCDRAVTGFVMHTVPVAVYAWLRHRDDFRRAITEVVRCGGDTDSVAAIVGAIVGAGLGADAIPASWLARTLELPGTLARLRGLARALARKAEAPCEPPPGLAARLQEAAWWPAMFVRNLVMFCLLIAVLLRRSTLVAWR
jgi:ADP-ribosylglycohydrolase